MRASCLWRRGPTWFFQITPPKHLHGVLGSTPLRLRLPVTSVQEASSLARILAGHAEAEFRTVARVKLDLAALQKSSDHDDDYDTYDEPSYDQSLRKSVLARLTKKIVFIEHNSDLSLAKVGIHVAHGDSKREAATREVLQQWRANAEDGAVAIGVGIGLRRSPAG